MKSIESSGEEKSGIKIDMVRVYINDAMKRIDNCASQILAAMEKGDTLHTPLGAFLKMLKQAC